MYMKSKILLTTIVFLWLTSITASAEEAYIDDTVDQSYTEQEYIIDNLDSSQYYESSDRFANSSTGNVSINGYHRWVQQQNDYAEFKKSDVQSGYYDVYYYLPLQHANNLKCPLFKITDAEGKITEKTIDITGYTSGDWIYLGIYPFAENLPMSVKVIHPGVDNAAPERNTIRVNAVRLTKKAQFDLPPTAENLTLTGSLAVGSTLSGGYEFFDRNGAEEEGTIYKIYRSDNVNGDNAIEIESGEAAAVSGILYMIQKEDDEKYIILEIIPRSNDGSIGEPVRAIVGPIADSWYAPVADQLKITGQPWVDYKLTGSYRYSDQNGDTERGTIYAWQFADSPESNAWTVFSEGVVEDSPLQVRIPEELLKKYIRLRIIPNNESLQNPMGEPAYSDTIGPVVKKNISPVVNEITLGGEMVNAEGIEGAAVDGTINVSYTYSHELGYQESGVEYQWYISDTRQGEYMPLPNNNLASMRVTPDMGRKFIKVSIRVWDEKQQFSENAYSEPIEVKWKLSFYDDFDYTATSGNDPAFKEKWISDNSQRVLGSPEIKSARIPENVEVRDGFLYIHNRKEHNDNYDFEHTWTTGNIKTVRDDFKYGYYEASYKLAPATGLNQSFWMMSDNVMEAGTFIELDFNEGHYPYEVATNLHYTEDGKNRKVNSIKYYPYGKGETTLASGFNKLAGLLKPNKLEYPWNASENGDAYQVYINDQLKRCTNSLPYDPMGGRIYFSVAIYPGFAGALVDSQADGTSMVVDYVRYYEAL